ncbi:rhodanese domain-containing protein CG4456 [Procambarus clarkii]|uniref:rhodanese domain-containing protein CG4456 n=1 Tax=Procambarus clarkii TaxID=6728 RepID=UPI001E672E81|nr:rhodanese domain-containing protein CG4456-like [Procambarus clarkii]
MTTINYEELLKNLSELLVVDVRTREEVKEHGQLPGSHVLPVQELEESLGLGEESFKTKYGFPKLNPEDPTLVILCRSGRRVGFAHDILKAKGFTKHKLYYGSFLDWSEKGGPITKPGQPYAPQE